MESPEDTEQCISPQVQAGLMKLHLGNAVEVNPAIRDYWKEAKSEDSTGLEAWVSKSEIPSSEEILGTDLPEDDEDCVELMPNRINGPWPSKNSYLRAHYELLREDSVAPLRDAVAYVKEEPRMMDSKNVSIYEKVCPFSSLYDRSKYRTCTQITPVDLGSYQWDYLRAERHCLPYPVFNETCRQEHCLGVLQAFDCGYSYRVIASQRLLSNRMYCWNRGG